jgi:hypothetical protein
MAKLAFLAKLAVLGVDCFPPLSVRLLPANLTDDLLFRESTRRHELTGAAESARSGNAPPLLGATVCATDEITSSLTVSPRKLFTEVSCASFGGSCGDAFDLLLPLVLGITSGNDGGGSGGDSALERLLPRVLGVKLSVLEAGLPSEAFDLLLARKEDLLDAPCSNWPSPSPLFPPEMLLLGDIMLLRRRRDGFLSVELLLCPNAGESAKTYPPADGMSGRPSPTGIASLMLTTLLDALYSLRTASYDDVDAASTPSSWSLLERSITGLSERLAPLTGSSTSVA